VSRIKRPAISRTVTLGLVALLVVAVAAGYFLTRPNQNSAQNGPVTFNIRIVETDPILQIDHFQPDNITVKLGQNVTMAVQNTDDETRSFVIKDFNLNFTIFGQSTTRGTFTANKVGTFQFESPATLPSAASHGKPGPRLVGNITVTP
jgi:heme/copper-type cytochrome/quinol oxidase subunit 2